MPLVVKENESLDPTNIRFLGFIAVVPRPNRLANLIEELGFRMMMMTRWPLVLAGSRRFGLGSVEIRCLFP